ncbi:MAG: hypothetical protein NC548_62790, partial [Lachnospiraceae bacterium]|nr:hypothetical protein [Lachnospiraceae bacterium]
GVRKPQRRPLCVSGNAGLRKAWAIPPFFRRVTFFGVTVVTVMTVILGYPLARAVTVMPPFFYPKPQGVG